MNYLSKVNKDGSTSTESHVHKINENEMDLRKGPWTLHEDTILSDYIASHGEGHWNSVARCAGLRRSGKSCRLRWLNYLRPDVRRGNITLQEQILILDLHSRWGNRWSKIAQHLPGRTDNEIKNYWRTRVIKQAKQLKCDVNSNQFRDTLRNVWMPRLLERVQPNTPGSGEPLQPPGIEWLNPSHSASDSSSSVEFQVPSISNRSESSGHDKGSDLCPSFNDRMFEQGNGNNCGDSLDGVWNDDGIWFIQQQFCDDVEMKYNSLP